ncbi:MAG: hypothetical protein GY771_04665 [bacterium]|nr:hypothetical protein [bacterium]
MLSCGGSTDDIKTEPPPGDVETEAPHTSRATAGEVPGKFTLDDADITLLAREPREGTQVVTFVYLRPYFSDVRIYDIIRDLNPQLGGTEGKPTPYGTWNDIEEVGYHETVGEIFEVFYPDVSGECMLSIETSDGPVTIELGDAAKTYR